MNRNRVLDLAYERFLTLESDEWGGGEIAAIRRYAWTVWYRPSRLQFARLVAECVADERTYAGGASLLQAKVQASLQGLTELDALRPQRLDAPSVPFPFLEAESKLGQIVCDAQSRNRVTDAVRGDFPYGARVAMLGDDDLVGLVLANANYPVAIFDVDPRIGDLVRDHSDVEFHHHDIRSPLKVGERFDAVLLDPADGSVALAYWLERVNECLSLEDGARAYLSVNLWRLGRRWSRVVDECLRYGLVPCDAKPRAKTYPHSDGGSIATDLWVFERTDIPSSLPRPYLDIEVFR